MAALTARVTTEDRPQAGALPDFTRLVQDNQAMVFSIAYHFLADRALAEELAQDVFLQLYRNLGKLESETHVKNWLRKVASHRCIDYGRRAGQGVEVAVDPAREPADVAEMADPFLNERLRKMVASLPEKKRLLVILRYQEDMEPNEIAALLGMPVTTVRTQLFRTLEHLREKASRVLGKVY